jgi:hypothetical protein
VEWFETLIGSSISGSSIKAIHEPIFTLKLKQTIPVVSCA